MIAMIIKTTVETQQHIFNNTFYNILISPCI